MGGFPSWNQRLSSHGNVDYLPPLPTVSRRFGLYWNRVKTNPSHYRFSPRDPFPAQKGSHPLGGRSTLLRPLIFLRDFSGETDSDPG